MTVEQPGNEWSETFEMNMNTDADYERASQAMDLMKPTAEVGEWLRLFMFVPATHRLAPGHPGFPQHLRAVSCGRQSFESLIRGYGLVTSKPFHEDGLTNITVTNQYYVHKDRPIGE